MSNNPEIKISMLSSAEKVKGQGVASAYQEQVNLVRELPENFKFYFNKVLNIDIAHFHTIDLKHYFFIPLIKKKGMLVAYVHFLPETIEGSLELPGFIKTIFTKYIIDFYMKMNYLVTVNPYFIEKLVDYGIPRQKIFYIPNFVSKEKFYPYSKSKCQEEKEKMNISQDSFIVLGVGQVQTRKGVIDFVKVAQEFPGVQFIWAGGFSFGKITDGYKQLKKIIKNPPLNVKFTGIIPRKEMNSLYNIADVLFLPSYNELFPMTILEAMNCHLPLLLRDITLYEKILAGFYLKAASNQGFIEKLKKLLTDKIYYKQAQKKSEAGKRYYSKNHVLAMWREFYQRVYQEKAAGN